jgi:NADH-quinone oxidoreductase subunit M
VGFQSTYTFVLTPTLSFGLRLGVDGISLFFLLLTTLFHYLCVLSLSPSTPRRREAILYLLFLQFGVLATFCALDLLAFFLFFELTLIPIYFLVLL